MIAQTEADVSVTWSMTRPPDVTVARARAFRPRLFLAGRMAALFVGLFAGLLVSFLVGACAVPVPPSGGGPDTTPPRLVESWPRQGATLVDGRTVEITFSEAVDRGSFARAWSVTPDMPGPADISWNGFDRVRISFPEPFRAATTYIFTIDTALRDVRNVALMAPISLAFATGRALDKGRLAGFVRDPATGNPVPGMDILLFGAAEGSEVEGAPGDIMNEALYRTQTGPDGRFDFDFLAERAYSVIGHGDRNRNRQLDQAERWAVAATRSVMADSAGAVLARPLWPVRFDTTAPRVVRVEPISNRDLALRVSEPVQWMPSGKQPVDQNFVDAVRDEGLFLVDSLGAMRVVSAPFATPDPLVWQLRTAEPLAPGAWRLEGRVALTDSAGHPVAEGEWPFTIRGTEPEASPARAVRIEPEPAGATDDGFRPLWPRDSLVVVWSAPPDEGSAELIALEDTSGSRLVAAFRAQTPTRTLVSRPRRASPADPSQSDPSQSDPSPIFRLSAPDTSVMFRVMGPADTGDILGTVKAPAPTIIELYADRAARQGGAAGGGAAGSGAAGSGPAGGRSGGGGSVGGGSVAPVASVRVPSGTHTFRFGRLPGGFQYRLRAFVDLDGNGAWTPGRLEPWSAAEPLLFARGTDPVRARWESVRADTLTFLE